MIKSFKVLVWVLIAVFTAVMLFIGLKIDAWDDACLRRDYCEEFQP